jgi:capsular polysaccharide biosynthesis protein/Flp pilus assembly protein TadD
MPAKAPTVGEVLDTAEAAIARGEAGRAAAWLARVREAAPLHPRVHHLEALVHRAEGRPQKAMEALRRSLVLLPRNPAAVSQSGVISRALGEWSAALAAHRRAARLDPDNPDLLYNLANILNDMARLREAETVLARALALSPLDPDGHRLMARIRLAVGAGSRAAFSARRAIITAPERCDAYLTASALAREDNQQDRAWRLLTRAGMIAPLAPGALFNRIRLALEQGRVAEAAAASRRAVLATPEELGPALDHGGAVLAEGGGLTGIWRWVSCLAGLPPRVAETFVAARVVPGDALLDPDTRPGSISLQYPPGHAPEDDPGGDAVVLTIRNATILTASQSLLSADGLLLHEGISPLLAPADARTGAGVLYRGMDGTAVVRPVEPVVRLLEATLLGTGGGGNYYHWLIDFLPRLYTLSRHPESPAATAPLLISDDCPPAIRDLLALLGLGKDRLAVVARAGPVAAEMLHVPAMPSLAPTLFADALCWLRERVANLPAPESGGARVYLDRGGAATRRLLNAAEVEDLLSRHGFKVVTPDPGSIQQQIAAVSSARVMVSVHGAALANMLFAPPGCQIVELSYPGAPDHLPLLARALGHRHHAVICEARPDAALRPGRWDLRAPLAELSAMLDSLSML